MKTIDIKFCLLLTFQAFKCGYVILYNSGIEVNVYLVMTYHSLPYWCLYQIVAPDEDTVTDTAWVWSEIHQMGR